MNAQTQTAENKSKIELTTATERGDVNAQTHTALPVTAPPSALEADRRLILPGVSWTTSERLLADFSDSHAAHFPYDQGVLEIVVLSLRHEKLKHILETLVEFLAAELDIDIEGATSTTFHRANTARGFEPDACFSIANADYTRHKEEADLPDDPPPDLVIEIALSSPSLDKLPICAAVGVSEVWGYDGRRLGFFRLNDGEYRASENSLAFPRLTPTALTEFVEETGKLASENQAVGSRNRSKDISF